MRGLVTRLLSMSAISAAVAAGGVLTAGAAGAAQEHPAQSGDAALTVTGSTAVPEVTASLSLSPL